jgi:hypothetical protein
MGFNRRRSEAEQRAMPRRSRPPSSARPILRSLPMRSLVALWNGRQAKRTPMLFSPTIGAAIAAGYWFLWVRYPAWARSTKTDTRGVTAMTVFAKKRMKLADWV